MHDPPPPIGTTPPASVSAHDSPFDIDRVIPRPAPDQRLDPRAVRAWRLGGAVTTLVWLLLAFGIAAGLAYAHRPWWVAALPLLLPLLAGAVSIWLVPSLRWHSWRYAVSERDIDLQHGILVVTRTLVPMARVQHVDTHQGPILRYFGLATVQIATAGGAQEIPALSLEVAATLRDRIAELAGVAEDL